MNFIFSSRRSKWLLHIMVEGRPRGFKMLEVTSHLCCGLIWNMSSAISLLPSVLPGTTKCEQSLRQWQFKCLHSSLFWLLHPEFLHLALSPEALCHLSPLLSLPSTLSHPTQALWAHFLSGTCRISCANGGSLPRSLLNAVPFRAEFLNWWGLKNGN